MPGHADAPSKRIARAAPALPAQVRRFRGAYVFADFLYGWLRAVRFTPAGRVVGAPETVGTGLSGPVAVHEGPDGLLYYLSLVTGELLRIVPRK